MTSRSPAERARAFQLFEEALGLEPEARATFLDRGCPGNAALREEVLALLGAEERLGHDAQEPLPPLSPDRSDMLGRVLGRFRLLELLGQGGMGVVYRAERTDGIDQKVALKVLLGGGLSGTRGGRFAREMRTLARLEHPAVARLVDAGTADDGTPWIAMELVSGAEPIDSYCRARDTPLRERVRLLAELADAVAQAHRMFVVHRDIKPSNVLMTREGTPKLIDFGIAKLLDDRSAEATLTGDAGALFTPQYAAPEQVSGAPASTATDVFGLGALGFRLLTGRTIHPEATSPLAYMLAVTQRDPPLASHAAREQGALLEARLLRGDLDAILARALSRDPPRRYATAEELREELRRYLEHRTVRARPPSLARGAARFLRRNALASALVALLAAALASAAWSYVWQAHRVAQERDRALSASARAERINAFLTSMLQASDPAAGGRRDVTVAQVLDRAAEQANRIEGAEPLVAADALLTVVQADSSLGRFPEALAAEDGLVRLLRAQPREEGRLGTALLARAETLWSMSRYGEAEPTAREAIALFTRATHGDPARAPELGLAHEKLAMILANTNREAEAEAEYRAAREDLRAAGVADVRLAALLNDWAVLIGGQGRAQEALALQQEARAVVERSAPADHPMALSVEFNYAGALEAVGRREEAVAIYRQLIATRKRVLGPTHAETLWAQASLASVLDDLGRYPEAAEVAGPAALGLERTVGPAHNLTAFAWNVLGNAECGRGNFEAGIATLRRAEAARLALVGDRNWRTANTRVRIGICLSLARRFAEAEAILVPAVKALEEARGPSFERTQDGYQALRDLYRRSGRPDDAAAWDARIAPPRP